MPTGRPVCLKCPKCMRGKWGFPAAQKGVSVDYSKYRRLVSVRRSTNRHPHGHRATCGDCGHEWWTSLRQPVST